MTLRTTLDAGMPIVVLADTEWAAAQQAAAAAEALEGAERAQARYGFFNHLVSCGYEPHVATTIAREASK